MKTLKTAADILTLDIHDVKQVYSGRNGRCCCGCSGTHSTDIASIERRLKYFQKNIARVEVISDECASIESGSRLHVIYLFEPSDVKVSPADIYERFANGGAL